MKGKIIKRWVLVQFVKHRYWFNQGNNAFASVSAIPIEKVAVVMAAGKYLLGDHVDNWILYLVFGIYCVWRFVSRWLVGWFWHRNNGYDIETEWNKGKVSPGRMEIINVDELAEAVARVFKIKDNKEEAYKICAQCPKWNAGCGGGIEKDSFFWMHQDICKIRLEYNPLSTRIMRIANG